MNKFCTAIVATGFVALLTGTSGCFSEYRYYQWLQASSVDAPGSLEDSTARITLPAAILSVAASPQPVHTFVHSRGLAFAPVPLLTFGDAGDATFGVEMSMVPRESGITMDFRQVTFENGESPVSVKILPNGEVLSGKRLATVAIDKPSTFSMRFRCFGGERLITLAIGGLAVGGKSVSVPTVKFERKNAYTYIPVERLWTGDE